MRLLRLQSGDWIEINLHDELGVGGEARVVGVRDRPELVAKLYHQPTALRTLKLRAMLANPPSDPMAGQHQPMIAWPVDLLSRGRKDSMVAGFLMPRLHNLRPLVYFYNPKIRQRTCPNFGYPYLLRMARNLATAVGALHDRGYVIGDVNESNVLGSDRSLVTWVDTDSLQVPHPQNGHAFRCTVGKPEFTPPEMQGVDFHRVERTPEQDVFGLGVLLFQLLMEGAHPFDALFTGSGDPPPFEERIRQGHFPHTGRRGLPYRPKPFALPFDSLSPELQELFIDCFEHGHREPRRRPGARVWQRKLSLAEEKLKTCANNTQHRYSGHLSKCPWCQRESTLAGSTAPQPRATRRSPTRTTVVTSSPAIQPTPSPRPAWASLLARLQGNRRVYVAATVVLALLLGVLLWFRLRPQPLGSIVLEDGRPGYAVDLGGGVILRLARIEPGTFTMGSPPYEVNRSNDETAHMVTISKAFYLGVTEVTQKQWMVVMGNNPSSFKGDDLPVENVSWEDAVQFCRKLSEKTSAKVRLPTEAEWEYACRAGTTGAYSGTGDLDEMGWYDRNIARKTHAVGTKKANAWGLYDMHGNVLEWCQDWYEKDYPTNAVSYPISPRVRQYRVLRGGSWDDFPQNCRAASRRYNLPGNRGRVIGFRLALDIPVNPLPSAVLPSVPSTARVDPKIAELLTKATANDSKENGLAALTTLAELLKLDPEHAQAKALQAKIAGYYARVDHQGIIFALIPPGTFTMGSPLTEANRLNNEAAHMVTISKAFYLGVTEVTQKQWMAVMGNNPSRFKGDDLPVENVSWEDAVEFCKKLIAKEGKTYRLPTEAEWEYACRAGRSRPYSGTGVLDEMGWYSFNSGSTRAAAQKKANAWGLYDMHGNVGEWCQDWYEKDYPTNAVTDPMGPPTGRDRVLRGGSWCHISELCRAACRLASSPSHRDRQIGFRLARDFQ